MNKNPFVPQPATYTPPQPPLPPGPPPPQPAQPDYSAYWAAVQQAQQVQQPPIAPYPQQWPPQPPRPPPEQNALYANYGYGAQWQRQQQQQQQYHSPPAPVVHPPPPPPAATPGYNPYQPAVSYPQPYVPQAPQAMAQVPYPVAQPQQTPSQPMFNPHLSQPLPTMQQQRHGHHASPQHQPPAKRQRFDGPAQNQQVQQRQPPAQQFQPPIPPNQPSGSHLGPGHGRGGAPGSNQIPLGGRGGNRGGSFSNMGRGRGGSMNAGRGGPMGNRPSRGGGSFNAGSNSGRGGAGSLRGHNSRGHLGGNKDFHNRRGPGSGSFSQQSSSSRGRGYGHSSSNRPQRHDGNVSGTFGRDTSAPNIPSTSTACGKKDENRRTLTDFKIVGLEIRNLSWMWGVLSKPTAEAKANEDESSQVSVKVEACEEGSSLKAPVTVGDDIKSEVDDTSSAADVAERRDSDASPSKIPHAPTVSGNPPHSRIRIYFHTPVTADDSHPIPQNSFSLGTIPSDSRKGKRKKLDDDEDGDGDGGREPPPPPHMNDDRSSVAGSVAPSVAETASEGDWLMAAIVDGEETQRDLDAEGDEDDDERLHVSEIVEYHDALSETGEGEGRGGVSQGNVDADMPGILKASSDGHLQHEEDSAATAHGAPPSSQGVIVDATDVSKDTSAGSEMESTANSTTAVSVHASDSSVDYNRFDAASVSDATSPVLLSHLSRSDKDTADHTEHLDSQVSDSIPDSTNVEAVSIDVDQSGATSASIPNSIGGDNALTESQMSEISGDQSVDVPGSEHLPEPPASPVSNTLLSTSSSSTYGDSQSQPDKDRKANRTPSANRLSISYAGGNRRLVIDAEVVDSVKIYRSEGRIEVEMKVQRDSDGNLEGIFMEGLSDVTKSYAPVQETGTSVESDPTLPPFITASSSMSITLVAYLDTERPLSEPRWVRTGDIPDWLRSMFGRMFWATGDTAEGWEKKITVVDPDPPPTIWTVLEGWAQNSPVGLANERQRFLKTHMSETENVLEILLRLVRGERATAFSSGSTISAPSVSGPLLSALSQGTAHGSQQTHVSLAVLAMFQMTVDYASKAMGEKGKTEVEERTGEIIRCLPSHLIYKSLDGIFKEWRVEKKGR